MTDPLSIGASIAGLVTLSELVFRKIFKYVQAARGAEREITTLYSETGALHGILSSLSVIASQLDGEAFDPSTRAQHVWACMETLKKLNEILDRQSTSHGPLQKVESIKRKLRWPFTSSEVKTLLGEIERHKTSLGLALNVDGLSGLLKSLSTQRSTNDGVNDIKSTLKRMEEAETRIALDTTRRAILESFGNLDPSTNQKMNIKLRQPGTGIWFTKSQEFQDWLQTDNAQLWAHGIPGAGKTILAATVIEEALQYSSDSKAVAYFYCDYKVAATQEAPLILGSLIQQIARQDEQSFEKVRTFYNNRNSEHNRDHTYDSEELRDLILDITLPFEETAIIVDGLDECGSNMSEVTELLASLNTASTKANIKTMFLSRDEVEIHDCLEGYIQISIAARSSDLTLYVAAEIEMRMRKRKLQIKDHSIKEEIMKQLVNGAKGMFRWVTCQMDYLCELPNDSARRKALGELPPTLKATYERILRRVNASSKDVQILVSRTLRWIIHRCDSDMFTTEVLCEAVSIDVGESRRDVHKIPDEAAILRWCSSLIRQSTDGKNLELAHFTVEEFLRNIAIDDCGEFAIYKIGPGHDGIELAKVCLTYLNYQDFDVGGCLNKDVVTDRFSNYPLRKYAVNCWYDHAKRHLMDDGLIPLIDQLLSPTKPNTLVSWAQDLFLHHVPPRLIDVDDADEEVLAKIDCGIAEANTLHFAAMLPCPDVCARLIGRDFDVNRNSGLGSPLHCALVGPKCCIAFYLNIIYSKCASVTSERDMVVSMLLEAGADPNSYFSTGDGPLSPLYLSLSSWDSTISLLLLAKGAKIDSHCLELLNQRIEDSRDIFWTMYYIGTIITHVEVNNVDTEHYSQLLDVASKARILSKIHSLGMNDMEEKEYQLQKIKLESSLRSAAEFGQIAGVAQLVNDKPECVNSAERGTGLTALHYAAMRNHSDIVVMLLSHGAQVQKTDDQGRSAVHHAIHNGGLQSLEKLLENKLALDLSDNEGLNVWHAAALKDNTHTLEMLANVSSLLPPMSDSRTKDGRSPLLCAASAGSTNNVRWLCAAGGTKSEVANDGTTALHLAAQSGSLPTVKLLLDLEFDVDALTEDGSTVLHHALSWPSDQTSTLIELLIERGVDPRQRRNDGTAPVEILIRDSRAYIADKEQSDRYRSLAFLSTDPTRELLSLFEHILSALGDSDWTLKVLEYLLAKGADLEVRNSIGKTAFQLLTDTWQTTRMSIPYKLLTALTRMMHVAIGTIGSEGLLHEICTNPILSMAALSVGDELLVKKFLEHHPDVDATIDGYSILKTACTSDSSCSLLQDILQRSKLSPCRMQGLVQACCYENPQNILEILEILLQNGFNPSDIEPGPSDIEPDRGVSALMTAAWSSNTAVMELLIARGASLHTLSTNGSNVVHYACAGGHQASLEVLSATQVDWNLKTTWNVNSCDLDGASALHIAASVQSNACLEYLLAEGLMNDIDAVDNDSGTALHIAAWCSRPLNVSALLLRNANTGIKATSGEIPIHIAIRQGSEETVAVFLRHSRDAGFMDEFRLECEMLAIKYGHQTIAKMFRESTTDQGNGQQVKLKSGQDRARALKIASKALKIAIETADLDLYNRVTEERVDLGMSFDGCNGCTPLLHALHGAVPHEENRFIEIIESLATRGAPFEGPTCVFDITVGYTAFHYATHRHYANLLGILLDKYPTKIFELQSPIHPIHLAVLHGSEECTKIIVDHYRNYGVDYWVPQISKQSLESLKPMKNIDCHNPSGVLNPVKFLLKTPAEGRGSSWCGCLPNGNVLPNKLRSGTPLHIAVCGNNLQLLKYLLESGAPVDVVNDYHETPLHLAISRGKMEMVELLLDSGANINAVDVKHETACIKAAYYDQLDILKELRKRGADFQAKDSWGASALDWAAACSHESFCYLLTTCDHLHDLGYEDLAGDSPLSSMMTSGNRHTVSFILNLAPNSAAYQPQTTNFLTKAVRNGLIDVPLLKKLLKRLPQDLIPTILSHRSKRWGTPLYAACTSAPAFRQYDTIILLLKEGAQLEHEGGEYGTPLMGACAAGRLSVVKLLVSRGARLIYDRDGLTVSALKAAKYFPEIVQWLLVERFMQGPRLLTGHQDR